MSAGVPVWEAIALWYLGSEPSSEGLAACVGASDPLGTGILLLQCRRSSRMSGTAKCQL